MFAKQNISWAIGFITGGYAGTAEAMLTIKWWIVLITAVIISVLIEKGWFSYSEWKKSAS